MNFRLFLMEVEENIVFVLFVSVFGVFVKFSVFGWAI